MTTIKPLIRKGSHGPAVVELQEILTMCGYDCGACDGIFGKKTEDALKRFQKDAGLEADGICGPKTWAAIEKAEAQAPVAPGEPVTYTVTCRGMTWAQVQTIRETCPTADVARE